MKLMNQISCPASQKNYAVSLMRLPEWGSSIDVVDPRAVFVLSAVEVSVASNTTYQRNRMLGTRLSCANLAAVKLKLL
ncbi:hypothetical protein PI126_g12893 [Phytophthora idaei]|nr:hypothetical protein PI126_g12893 [Phytophthora idaei]